MIKSREIIPKSSYVLAADIPEESLVDKEPQGPFHSLKRMTLKYWSQKIKKCHKNVIFLNWGG